MASISNDPGGFKRITFTLEPGGVRIPIRLGKVNSKQAEAFATNLEALITWRITGRHDPIVAAWLADMPDKMYAKLVKKGLVKPRESDAAPATIAPEPVLTIGKFLDEYFATLNVKDGTLTAYKHTDRCMREHFTADKPLKEIKSEDAHKFVAWMRQQGLASATVSKRISVSRMIFGAAVEWEKIAKNPFRKIKVGKMTNKARIFFIPRDVADKVLEACPDAQWKLLFSLSRFGGLRCPSEHLALKWSDVNFEKGTILIHSSKTEHHEGKDTRLLPMFPELRKPLLDAFTEAEPGTEYVITRYRDPNCNLRTQFERILNRAGVKPWPKLFHNLRASRQNELTDQYPAHVVNDWIGNSRDVAESHYLQTLDSHMAKASAEPEKKSGAKSGALSGALYDRQATTGHDTENPDPQKTPVFRTVTPPDVHSRSDLWARQDSNL